MYSSFMNLIGQGGAQDRLVDETEHDTNIHNITTNSYVVGPTVDGSYDYGPLLIGQATNSYASNCIAIGNSSYVTGHSNIAIGSNTYYNPGKQIKMCHKHCKVTWPKEDECPTIQCQVYLQLAVWESLYKHPMYYVGLLPRDIFNIITNLIKDQEIGEYHMIRRET